MARMRTDHSRSVPALAWVLPISLLLGGCDMLGIETPALTQARKEAEGKAIGSACRHAVRSIEDCYQSNPKALKAAVFEGWKEMDAYMRENDIQGMPFVPPPPVEAPKEEIVTEKEPPTPAGKSGSKK